MYDNQYLQAQSSMPREAQAKVKGRALLQVYKQKVKHLLYEQQQIVAQLRMEAEARLEQVTSEAAAREQSLNTDKQSLQRQLNEQVGITLRIMMSALINWLQALHPMSLQDRDG